METLSRNYIYKNIYEYIKDEPIHEQNYMINKTLENTYDMINKEYHFSKQYNHVTFFNPQYEYKYEIENKFLKIKGQYCTNYYDINFNY